MNHLVDPFGRAHTYLRVSVTDRCNLRCAYCMPEEDMEWKDRHEVLSYEEIVRIARVVVGLGIEKIRITGGEPLVRSDIEKLLEQLKGEAGVRQLALTTNGVLLARKLPRVASLLDAVNISLDTFHRDRFLSLTRRDSLTDVLVAIDSAIAAGIGEVKINAVVMRGINEDELIDFVRFTADRPVTVRFIEFMPFAGNAWSRDRCVTMTEMLEEIGREFELERIPDGKAPISRDFSVVDRTSGRRHTGNIGIIASMSRPFCESCSRLRLTAEGKVMPCLHSPLEFDVRSILREGGSDEDVAKVFLTAVGAKPKEHPEPEEIVGQASRVMIQIGG